MRYLLDTHSLLWFLSSDPRLGRRAKELMEANNKLLVSIVSLWEVAIKMSIGKLRLPEPFEETFPAQLFSNGIEVLHLSIPHLTAVRHLPHHHRDPFDRLIAAQALVESLPLISVDAVFDACGIRREW